MSLCKYLTRLWFVCLLYSVCVHFVDILVEQLVVLVYFGVVDITVVLTGGDDGAFGAALGAAPSEVLYANQSD